MLSLSAWLPSARAQTARAQPSSGPLGEVGLETLRIVEIGKDAKGPVAKVRSPGGKIHTLRRGDDFVGVHYGIVTAVRADRIELKQLINYTRDDKGWQEAPGVIETKPDTRPSPRWDALTKAGDKAFKTNLAEGVRQYQAALAVALGLGSRDPRVGRSYEAIGILLLSMGDHTAEPALLSALSVFRNGFTVDAAAVQRVKQTLRDFYKAVNAPPEVIKALDVEPPQ